MSRKPASGNLEPSSLSSETTVKTGPPQPIPRGLTREDTLLDRLPAVGRLEDEEEDAFDPTRFAAHKIPPDLRRQLSAVELKRVDPDRFLDTRPPSSSGPPPNPAAEAFLTGLAAAPEAASQESDASAPDLSFESRREARLRMIRRRVGFTAAALLALAAALIAAQGLTDDTLP
jgi:hypothetical protein